MSPTLTGAIEPALAIARGLAGTIGHANPITVETPPSSKAAVADINELDPRAGVSALTETSGDRALHQDHIVFVEKAVGGTEITVKLTLANGAEMIDGRFPASKLNGRIRDIWAKELAAVNADSSSTTEPVGWDHEVRAVELKLGRSTMPLVDRIRAEVRKDPEVGMEAAPIVRPDMLARLVNQGYYPLIVTSDTSWVVPSMGKRNPSFSVPYQLLIGVKENSAIILGFSANGDARPSWAIGRELSPRQIEAAVGEATRVITGCRPTEEPKGFKPGPLRRLGGLIVSGYRAAVSWLN